MASLPEASSSRLHAVRDALVRLVDTRVQRESIRGMLEAYSCMRGDLPPTHVVSREVDTTVVRAALNIDFSSEESMITSMRRAIMSVSSRHREADAEEIAKGVVAASFRRLAAVNAEKARVNAAFWTQRAADKVSRFTTFAVKFTALSASVYFWYRCCGPLLVRTVSSLLQRCCARPAIAAISVLAARLAAAAPPVFPIMPVYI